MARGPSRKTAVKFKPLNTSMSRGAGSTTELSPTPTQCKTIKYHHNLSHDRESILVPTAAIQLGIYASVQASDHQLSYVSDLCTIFTAYVKSS